MTLEYKSRIKKSGEVFTPRSLIREMLDKLPNAVWFDPNKTWLEPSAGDGNFLVEVKARLMQAGHDEIHVLENMLFSIELIDDNHWVLQHRLGYLIEGQPNPKLDFDHFTISKIHKLTQDLNDSNPYHVRLGLDRNEVMHHRNHVCWTALEYNMDFSRDQDAAPKLPVLPERDLGAWSEVKDYLGFTTPDIGESTIIGRVFGNHTDAPDVAPVTKLVTSKESKPAKDKTVISKTDLITNIIRSNWDGAPLSITDKSLLRSKVIMEMKRELGLKMPVPVEMINQVKELVNQIVANGNH